MVETKLTETESIKVEGSLVAWAGFRIGTSSLGSCGAPLISVLTAKTLLVILGVSLTMEAQVTTVTRLAFLQLCHIMQLIPSLSPSDHATIIHTTIISRLDYCNASYIGSSLRMTQKLQLIQNAAAQALT